MTPRPQLPLVGRPRTQRGVTTLAITLILLVIITMMVIFSSNVGFFEQKTATNENRARISQQAAEYALNLAGEYLKANRDKLISNVAADNGWLAAGATRRWAKCSDVGLVDADFPAGHPCLSERDTTASAIYANGRRATLYFWTADGTTSGSQLMPYTAAVPAAAKAEAGMGGTAAFTTQTNVRALLCRLDTSLATPACRLEPVAGNRVAITVISDASLTNEAGAKAAVKETWASYSAFVPSASVPLVASGLVKGLGNGQIVANSDAATPTGSGSNIASIWSPNNVSIDGSGGGGIGSFITCQIQEFTAEPGRPDTAQTMSWVKENCPSSHGNSPPCNCPKAPSASGTSPTANEDWSGHGTGGGSTLHKGKDVLDVAVAGESVCDPNVNVIVNGCRSLPSITFFPGVNSAGTRMDYVADASDDSIFEYIFNVDYETDFSKNRDGSTNSPLNTAGYTMLNCGDDQDQNCFDYAMREQFDAEIVDDCGDLGPSTTGIVYVPNACSQLSQQIGTPESPAIVVINNSSSPSIALKQGTVVYGMLFVHSDTHNIDMSGTNSQVYGALVVEGDIKMTGNFTIVYDDTSSTSDPHKLPKSAKFGRVPGSWLDSKTSF
jgi:hypothetical protein